MRAHRAANAADPNGQATLEIFRAISDVLDYALDSALFDQNVLGRAEIENPWAGTYLEASLDHPAEDAALASLL